MTSILHRPATYPDGTEIPALHVRGYGGDSKICGIGFPDDDQGWVSIAEDVPARYAPLLAASSTLYYMVDEQASNTHTAEGHAENAGYPANYRECPMVSCQRASRALLGADRNGPLI